MVLKQTRNTHRISNTTLRSMLEWSAVISNLLFTLLYLNQSEWAFPLGIIGPLFLLVLSWREQLYAEPILQLVYIVSAIVGWLNVQGGWKSWQVSVSQQLVFFVLSVVIALLWGIGLKRYTRANFPILDAFIASWGMLATWLMMYQVHACWLYLMAVNVLSLFVYFRRRLYLATGMFFLYLLMAIDGYFMLNWFLV